MRTSLRVAAAAAASATALGVIGLAAPTQARVAEPEASATCLVPSSHTGHPSNDWTGSAARGTAVVRGNDHREMTASEQRAIAQRTRTILARKGTTPSVAGSTSLAVSIPVYVHVMAAKNGAGNVTDTLIANQIAVLNKTYGGQESSTASNTGFTFTLAGTDRFYNDNWHKDKQSSTYRSQTRKGGKNALNIWLVDFSYLGIATFPWDYSRNPAIDGIRVHYGSLPGGNMANYNLGETATHEAGHWLGLYHTFQGGCTTTNDEVSDTPAQSSSTSGCPTGRDSCSLTGLDPIHNYMDYSYDTCYYEFTAGQTSRMNQMWTAYRG